MEERTPEVVALVQRAHDLNREIACRQRELLEVLHELDEVRAGEDDGAHDMAWWIGQQFGISRWKAERWLATAEALRELPIVAGAFESGELGIDKVVELTRFATPEDEDDLVIWANGVACGAIRRRGELLARERRILTVSAEADRWLDWSFTDDGSRMELSAGLPSAKGAVVAAAIERIAAQVPDLPDAEPHYPICARRADALVALCSARLADAPDQDRATVVVHTDLEPLLDPEASASVEGGGVISGETLQRLLCNARVQTVIEHPDGSVFGLGRVSREPSAWMMRQLRYRDDTCRFPGCASRRFTQAHHVVWWSRGGRTELDNLILVCTFHHRLVHEHGWSVRKEEDGEVAWFRPGDVRYRAGPRAA